MLIWDDLDLLDELKNNMFSKKEINELIDMCEVCLYQSTINKEIKLYDSIMSKLLRLRGIYERNRNKK